MANEVQIAPLPGHCHVVFKKVCQSRMWWKNNNKNVTKPAQIVASLMLGKDKMDILPFTTWFVSLVFLMLSCKIANICRKPTSIQLQPVSECRELLPIQFDFERVNVFCEFQSTVLRWFIFLLWGRVGGAWVLFSVFRYYTFLIYFFL